MDMIWKPMMVFTIMLVLDFVWAKYTLAISKASPWWAGWHAACIAVLAGVGQIAYVGEPWLLLPAAMGAFAGTFLAMGRK